MDKGPHISIKPEVIFHVFGFPVTNSYITALIVLALFLLLALHYYSQLHKTRRSFLFYLTQFILRSIYNFFHSVLGDKIMTFFPYLGAFFVYILLLNWSGLLPGVGSLLIEDEHHHLVPLFRGNTADLNTTFALALTAFFLTQFYGIKYLGLTGYLGKFFNFSSVINFFVGILEFISEFSRIISFSFRLFGNIFAGEVILTIMAFLIPVFLPFPFLLMEIFVGFIQALVFSMLVAVFINLAITKHH